MTDSRAAELAENFVFSHLPDLLSTRSYIMKTLMRELAETFLILSDEKKYNDIIENAKKNTTGIVTSFSIPDIRYNNAPRKMTQTEMLSLACSYQRTGGMDICALALEMELDNEWRPEPFISVQAIEVKVDRKCRYLHLDKPDLPNKNGSLGFELWDHYWVGDSSNHNRYDVSQWTNGWLYGYLYPEEKTRNNIEVYEKKVNPTSPFNPKLIPASYCTPSVLMFVLADECERTDKLKPYAVIAFENTKELFDLLKSKLDGKLWPEWQLENNKDQIKEQFSKEIHENMLYVPMEELIKLDGVTVTLINDIPSDERVKQQVKRDYWEYKEQLVQSRRNYLQEIQTTNPTREERQQSCIEAIQAHTFQMKDCTNMSQEEVLLYLHDSMDKIRK